MLSRVNIVFMEKRLIFVIIQALIFIEHLHDGCARAAGVNKRRLCGMQSLVQRAREEAGDQKTLWKEF